jgi:tRNA(Met) cytidine acetyltransferase
VLQQTPVEQGTTVEQAHCLQQIEQWMTAGQTGIVLIYAKRGRGKSSCLGLLVERLAGKRVLVTANSKQNAETLLRLAPDAEFIAPDRLIRSCPPADLVVIDEAAMIPQSMLRQLSRLYPRLVMATTCDGYEGTGQGFMLRFVAALEVGSLMQIRLENPVRWCRQDQLEAWLERSLMLTDENAKPANAVVDLTACELQILEDPGAPESFPLLQQVYRLLNSAHYRTRPADLRMLMENPDLVLIVARCDALVVGAALLNIEGGLDADLCEQIFMGRRRPRGQLLAQMLTAQAGIRRFAGYRGIRVQRIAVAEGYRRQGLGTRLIEASLAYARARAMDYVGASFALDPDTAGFWQQAQFALVHVSFGQGKSSGNQSIAVLQALNPEVADDIGLLQQRIRQQLPTWMTQFLQTMDRGQVVALLRYAGFEASMNQFERGEIEAFAQGHKGFELCFASLQKYVMQVIAQSSVKPDGLLVEKAVQNRGWELLERESGAEGRRQLQQRLREQVDVLFKAC